MRSIPIERRHRGVREIVFETLFRRIPELKLAIPIEDIPFEEHGGVHGIHRLPVAW
ncbi:MAG TPA: hypothetical protein VG756_23120 [Pseudonocardiaceae bacterium]|nr:hypothetical protein [Pseudonocardiaceae bacterium]